MRLRICPASDDIIAYQLGDMRRHERGEPAAHFSFIMPDGVPDGTPLHVDIEFAPPGEAGWTLDVHLPDGSQLAGVTWWSDEDDDA